MSKELIVSTTAHETKVAILEDDELAEVYFEREQQYGLAGSIYKGRVTRVLPGMQSAFVNIGLDRDAFLYVSDFLEDNEEYDRIVTTVEDKVVKMEEKSAGQISAAPEGTEARALATEERNEAGLAGEAGGPEVQAPPEESAAASDVGRESSAPPRAERHASPPAFGPAAPGSASPGSAQYGAGPRLSGGPPGGPNRGRRGRRRRPGGGRGFPESKYASDPRPSPRAEAPPAVAEPITVPEPRAEQDDFELLPGESLAKYRQQRHFSETATHIEQREQQPAGPAEALLEMPAQREEHALPEDNTLLEEQTTEEPAHVPEEDPTLGEESLVPRTAAVNAVLAGEVEGSGAVSGAVDWAPIPDVHREPHSIVAESAAHHEEPLPYDRGNATDLAAGEANDLEAGEIAREAGASAAGVSSGSAIEMEEAAGEETPDEGFEASTDLAGEAGEFLEESEAEGIAGEASEGSAEGTSSLSAETPGQQQASVRERPFGQRYLHRGARRMRRRGRDFRERRGPAPDRQPAETARPATPEPVARTAQTSISDLLKEGQEIIVQIAKEPLGKKGARITSHIALPGRFLVYMPTVEHVGVSRKIFSDEERLRLKRVVHAHRVGMPGGFIVRTAGEGQSEEEIRSDMQFLYNLWLDLRQKAERRPAPTLVHHDLNLVERLLRDQLTDTFKTIWVDGQEDYERILQFVERFQPTLVSRVKLYTRSKPIFDEFGITPELEKALRPKVWLKSGGYIVINQTEALVAIDVNTGKYVGKSNRLEDTIVKTNMDAVKEIVRQIRLRDLGGIIVVDFIDMDERKNRQKVMQALDEALRADRSPSKILQFNDFGLVAITRKRVKQSLERTLCSPCPYCDSSGYVKSPTTMIQEILIEAKKIAPTVETGNVTLRVNPEVAKLLKSRDNSYLEELEGMLRRPVLVKSDPLLHQEKFDFN